jgi:hypothetical protein
MHVIMPTFNIPPSGGVKLMMVLISRTTFSSVPEAAAQDAHSHEGWLRQHQSSAALLVAEGVLVVVEGGVVLRASGQGFTACCIWVWWKAGRGG